MTHKFLLILYFGFSLVNRNLSLGLHILFERTLLDSNIHDPHIMQSKFSVSLGHCANICLVSSFCQAFQYGKEYGSCYLLNSRHPSLIDAELPCINHGSSAMDYDYYEPVN